MTAIPTITLNDRRTMPQFGLGTWKLEDAEAAATLETALAAGYRLIDTAAIYGNEAAIGTALRQASVPRHELSITTKVWNDRHGYDATLRAMEESLEKLRTEYVDLYLIHWPVPQRNMFVETWRALITLRDQGKAKSIGVSNFLVPHLQRLIDETGVVPAINQIELHPRLPQRELREFQAQHGIVTESWSPLARTEVLDAPAVRQLAAQHNRTPAQIVLRWHVQNGLIVIPKSSHPDRIRENAAIFDFTLTPADLATLSELATGERIGPDPETFAG